MAQIERPVKAVLDTEALVTEYATQRRKEHLFATMIDSDEIYRYDAAQGIYVNDGEIIIKAELENTVPDISNHKVNEVLGKIKRNTFVSREGFDNDPTWLHVDNGWLHLKTGAFEPHSAGRYSLSKMPVKYNSKAKCFAIKDFLKGTLDNESIAKIVRMLGYCLMPSCKYQKAFMFVGTGSNGKSVLISLIGALIGKNNSTNITLQELSDKFASAELFGKWINTCTDLPKQAITDTGKFKVLVSGDPVTAQHKFKGLFNFNNRAKLIFSANEIPDTKDTSYAYFRRWVIVPFRRTFEGADDDKNLIDKISTPEELSGLLNVAIAGMKALENEGGFSEENVHKIRQIYETNASLVHDFITERSVIDLTNKDCRIETTRLQEAYSAFCANKGSKALDVNVLGEQLRRLGVERMRKRAGSDRSYFYIGIKLKGETLAMVD